MLRRAATGRRLVTALVLATLMVVLAACGGGSGSQPGRSTGGEYASGDAGGSSYGSGSSASSGSMAGHGSHTGGDAGSASGGEAGSSETGGTGSQAGGGEAGSSESGSQGGTGGEGAGEAAGGETGEPAVVEVKVENFQFNPEDITIPAGVQVTFRIHNVDRAPHTFTVTDLGLDVALEPGQTVEVTVDPVPAGEYSLVCLYHPGMVGTVIVEDE